MSPEGYTVSNMALTVEEIASHQALHGLIRRQSQTLLDIYEANPRASSVFATQQRWLMGHAGLALHFRRDPADERGGLTAARFLEVIAKHRVASRNTADAFIKEMVKYDVARYLPGARDRRVRPLAPTAASVGALTMWAMAHLATLDSLDGGDRLAGLQAEPDSLARLQPLIADGLLTSLPVREPIATFSLFTWLNNGGIVMDWLISGIEPADVDAERIPTGVLSISDMAAWAKLSRTHLARKLRQAEAMGSLGWFGKRGNSTMWVSRAFRDEYAMAQAVKLAIIDGACEACFYDAPPVSAAARPPKPALAL